MEFVGVGGSSAYGPLEAKADNSLKTRVNRHRIGSLTAVPQAVYIFSE